MGEEDFAAVTLFGNTAPASVASVIVAVEISSPAVPGVYVCVYHLFKVALGNFLDSTKEVTMD